MHMYLFLVWYTIREIQVERTMRNKTPASVPRTIIGVTDCLSSFVITESHWIVAEGSKHVVHGIVVNTAQQLYWVAGLSPITVMVISDWLGVVRNCELTVCLICSSEPGIEEHDASNKALSSAWTLLSMTLIEVLVWKRLMLNDCTPSLLRARASSENISTQTSLMQAWGTILWKMSLDCCVILRASCSQTTVKKY